MLNESADADIRRVVARLERHLRKANHVIRRLQRSISGLTLVLIFSFLTLQDHPDQDQGGPHIRGTGITSVGKWFKFLYSYKALIFLFFMYTFEQRDREPETVNVARVSMKKYTVEYYN